MGKSKSLQLYDLSGRSHSYAFLTILQAYEKRLKEILTPVEIGYLKVYMRWTPDGMNPGAGPDSGMGKSIVLKAAHDPDLADLHCQMRDGIH